MRASLPHLASCNTPFDPELVGSLEGDLDLFNLVRMQNLPEPIAGGALEQFLHRFTLRSHRRKQRFDAFGVRLGHRGERIEGQQDFVGLLSSDVEYHHRHLRIRRHVSFLLAIPASCC
jgi:hypothetical protein